MNICFLQDNEGDLASLLNLSFVLTEIEDMWRWQPSLLLHPARSIEDGHWYWTVDTYNYRIIDTYVVNISLTPTHPPAPPLANI